MCVYTRPRLGCIYASRIGVYIRVPDCGVYTRPSVYIRVPNECFYSVYMCVFSVFYVYIWCFMDILWFLCISVFGVFFVNCLYFFIFFLWLYAYFSLGVFWMNEIFVDFHRFFCIFWFVGICICFIDSIFLVKKGCFSGFFWFFFLIFFVLNRFFFDFFFEFFFEFFFWIWSCVNSVWIVCNCV